MNRNLSTALVDAFEVYERLSENHPTIAVSNLVGCAILVKLNAIEKMLADGVGSAREHTGAAVDMAAALSTPVVAVDPEPEPEAKPAKHKKGK